MKILDFFKKPLESASDEITTKFKTPFFSTFIILWVIKNNLFVYDLFFNVSIKDKTDLLKTQFNIGELSFYMGSLKLIGITLLILVLFYIILNISRMITMVSEERIKINLLASLKSKTISTKEDVEFWKKRADDFKIKNRELESELSVVRSNSDHYKTQLKKATEETDQVIKNGKAHVRRIQSILDNNLYIFKKVPNGMSMTKIEELKTQIDAEFNRFDEELKPKTPSFLMV